MQCLNHLFGSARDRCNEIQTLDTHARKLAKKERQIRSSDGQQISIRQILPTLFAAPHGEKRNGLMIKCPQ